MTTSDRSVPPVLTWYRVYCAAMAVMYLACVVGGVAVMAFRAEIAAADAQSSPGEWLIMGAIFAVVGFGCMLLYGAAFLIPRAPWAWIYHLVLIGFGLTSCCCMPASIPLMIFWVKPEVQAFYGRS